MAARRLPTPPNGFSPASQATSNLAVRGGNASVNSSGAAPTGPATPMGQRPDLPEWITAATPPTMEERLDTREQNGWKPFNTFGQTQPDWGKASDWEIDEKTHDYLTQGRPPKAISLGDAMSNTSPASGPSKQLTPDQLFAGAANAKPLQGQGNPITGGKPAATQPTWTPPTTKPATGYSAKPPLQAGGGGGFTSFSPQLSKYTAAPSAQPQTQLLGNTAAAPAGYQANVNSRRAADLANFAPRTGAAASPLDAYAVPMDQLAEPDPNRALNAMMYSRAQNEALRRG